MKLETIQLVHAEKQIKERQKERQKERNKQTKRNVTAIIL